MAVENRLSFVTEGAVPPLIQLMGSSSPEMQERAAVAVWSIAAAAHGSIVTSEAVPLLVDILRSSCSEKVQLVLVWILDQYASTAEHAAATVTAAGAIPPLVQLL